MDGTYGVPYDSVAVDSVGARARGGGPPRHTARRLKVKLRTLLGGASPSVRAATRPGDYRPSSARGATAHAHAARGVTVAERLRARAREPPKQLAHRSLPRDRTQRHKSQLGKSFRVKFAPPGAGPALRRERRISACTRHANKVR